ncbi:hypothetical protein HN51_028014, partial [Arachis hypogaea]
DVDVGMAEAGGRAVKWRHKKRLSAVEVNNGIGACDVEREGTVELNPLVNLIGGDTRVRQERHRTDNEALGLRVYGLDRVRVFELVEDESVGGTMDLVGGIATGWVVMGRLEYLAFCSLLLHNQHQLLVLLLRFREKVSLKSENLAAASTDNIDAKPESKPIDKQVKVFFAIPKTVAAKIELPDGVVLQGVFSPWKQTMTLYEFVNSALKQPGLEFELIHLVVARQRTIPQFTKAGKNSKTLEDEDLIPSTLINYQFSVSRHLLPLANICLLGHFFFFCIFPQQMGFLTFHL